MWQEEQPAIAKTTAPRVASPVNPASAASGNGTAGALSIQPAPAPRTTSKDSPLVTLPKSRILLQMPILGIQLLWCWLTIAFVAAAASPSKATHGRLQAGQINAGCGLHGGRAGTQSGPFGDDTFRVGPDRWKGA